MHLESARTLTASHKVLRTGWNGVGGGSTRRKIRARRQQYLKGAAEERTDCSLCEGLWQGPVQLTQHLIRKLGLSSGGGQHGLHDGSQAHSPEARRLECQPQATWTRGEGEAQHLGGKSSAQQHRRWRLSSRSGEDRPEVLVNYTLGVS